MTRITTVYIVTLLALTRAISKPLILLGSISLLSVASVFAGVTVEIAGKTQLAKVQVDGMVVFLNSVSPSPNESITGRVEMSQKDRQFDPYIQVVTRGGTVHFPNSDPVAHHVYSFSPTKPFELPLYKGNTNNIPNVTMNKTGVVTVGCNIHDWMVGYIYVADTPYYAQVKNLRAVIDHAPPGQYVLGVWHPGMDAREAIAIPVTLNGQIQQFTVQLQYAIQDFPQPKAPEEQFDEMDDY